MSAGSEPFLDGRTMPSVGADRTNASSAEARRGQLDGLRVAVDADDGEPLKALEGTSVCPIYARANPPETKHRGVDLQAATCRGIRAAASGT